MRVFTATLVTETNTFSPIPTGMAAFRHDLLCRAGEHPDRPTLFTGPLWAARQRAKERNWQLSEGLCAVAQPGGITARATYEALRDELLDDLRRALPVDMVLLQLHGAMVADGYEDCEADVLARVRALVGQDTVVGVELDSHCHLSAAMLQPADVMVIFKEYPHTDALERAFELVDLCAATATRDIRPVMATFDCRMAGVYHTPRQPMRGFVDRLKALEGKDGILSVSVAQGFPWGDTPDMGTKILVVSDGDRARAEALAEKLGRELIGLRGNTTPQYLTINQALDRAALLAGPAVIADTADNAGGGAPSDSTFLLRAILARGLSDVCIGPFWDPVAVRFAHEAGEGARLHLRLGG
jgi:microcystin degradation protein MlrC